jgi:hypothetical protein
MHTVTISLQGSVSVSESVEVGDADALPLFVKLKAVLDSGEASKPKGRRRKSSEAADASLPEPGGIGSREGEEG